jgi:hypothetical protein
LSILDRSDRVGETRTGGHTGHSDRAAEPRDGVGGKHRRDLVPHVDNANATLFRSDQNRRDVAANERKYELDLVRRQHLGHKVAAVRRSVFACHQVATW